MRLQARDDTEHEQALIRIGVAFVMYFYLLAIPLPADDHAFIVRWVTVIFGMLSSASGERECRAPRRSAISGAFF